MKKIKESLLFVSSLLLLVAGGLVSLFWDLASHGAGFYGSGSNFEDALYYVRMYLKDNGFRTVSVRTGLGVFAVTLAFVLLFALIAFFLRKRIRIPRLAFYLVGFGIGSMVSLVCLTYLNIHVFGLPSAFYSAHSLLATQPPSALIAVSLTTVLFSLAFGVLEIFIVWLLEPVYRRADGRKRNG